MDANPLSTPTPDRGGVKRLVLAFVVVNLLVFLAYRLLFLARYVDGAAYGQQFKILLYGVRIDLALLGAELAVLLLLSLLRLRIRLRAAFTICLVLTALNTALCAADLVFYGARGEHLARLLVTSIASPGVLGEEIGRFASHHPGWALLVVAALAAFVWLAVRLVRRVPARSWSHVRPKRRLLYVFVFFVFFTLPIYQPVHVVGGDRIVEGWSVDVANPEHYEVFDDYVLHQALPNPLHDLLFGRLPQLLAAPPPPRFAPDEAASLLHGYLPGEVVDPAYPLLRRVHSDLDLGLENVLIVQVEGLSGSLIGQDEDGRAVMPFLRDLVSRSLYYPNGLHGYPTTYGGLHSLTASIPRTATEVIGGRFVYAERQGFFGSAPRILPEFKTYAFLHNGWQTSDDLRTYMGNQGFHTTDWVALAETLGETIPEAELLGVQGVWDGPLLKEVGHVLRTAEKPAFVQALTTATHMPWQLPPSVPAAFDDEVLACFSHLDGRLRALFEHLQEDPDLMARTLVVIVADHVSFTSGHNELDRTRVPLIFYNPRFEALGLAKCDERWATHADVMRTVLALLGGEHDYAGLGRNLLDPIELYGTLASSKDELYYVRDGHVLRWSYAKDTVTMHAASKDGWASPDLAREDPERFARLSNELFALFEGVRTLVETGRVFPR